MSSKYRSLLAEIKKHLNEALLIIDHFPGGQKQLHTLKSVLYEYEKDEQKTLRRIYSFLYDRSPAGYQDLFYPDENRSRADIDTLMDIHKKIHELLTPDDEPFSFT